MSGGLEYFNQATISRRNDEVACRVDSDVSDGQDAAKDFWAMYFSRDKLLSDMVGHWLI